MMSQVAIIGAGESGGAVARALASLREKALHPIDTRVFDPDPEYRPNDLEYALGLHPHLILKEPNIAKGNRVRT